jgi:cell division septum initiation protein DivIVA
VKFVVDRNAEADRLKAEADELTAKSEADAEATLAKAKAEASEILATAKAQAQDTITRSQAEADERHRRLEEELAALREEADARLRELQADTQAVWRERDQMLEGIRAMANDLGDIAKSSVARLQPDQPAAPNGENDAAGAAHHDKPAIVKTDESTSDLPAAGTHRSSGESERGG